MEWLNFIWNNRYINQTTENHDKSTFNKDNWNLYALYS